MMHVNVGIAIALAGVAAPYRPSLHHPHLRSAPSLNGSVRTPKRAASRARPSRPRGGSHAGFEPAGSAKQLLPQPAGAVAALKESGRRKRPPTDAN